MTLVHDKYLFDLLKKDDTNLETRKPTMTKRFWTYIRSKRQDNVGVAPLEINDDAVSDSREKANLLSNYFKSVFTKEDPQNMTPEATSPKTNGPHGIPCYKLQDAAAELAPFLQFLLTQSLLTGSVPQALSCQTQLICTV